MGVVGGRGSRQRAWVGWAWLKGLLWDGRVLRARRGLKFFPEMGVDERGLRAGRGLRVSPGGRGPVGVSDAGPAQGRAGRRLPQQGALFQARRRGRARGRRAGLEAELQQLDLGAEAAAPTGTGLVSDGGNRAERGDSRPPWDLVLEGLVQRCVPVQCRPATDEELLLVHSPSFVAQLESPDSPPQGGSGPRWAVGAALALLEQVLGGTLRNGVALMSVLIVDWSPQPGRSLPRLFQEDPSVLYFGAQRGREPPPSTGHGPGEGFSVELRWEQPGVTDGDYAAAAFHVLLPIAFQFQPELVLVEASLEDLGGSLGVSPSGFSLLTHLLSALGRGRLLLLLQRPGQHCPHPERPPAVLGLPAEHRPPYWITAILIPLRDTPLDTPKLLPDIPKTPHGSSNPLGDPSDPQEPPPRTPKIFWGNPKIGWESTLRCPSCTEVEEEEEEEEEEKEEEEGEAEAGEEEEEDEEEKEELEGDGPPPETPPEPPPRARVGLVYDPRMEEHRNTWDSHHPECPQRLARVLQRLQELGLAQRCLRVPARLASPQQLRACHTRAHVRALSRTPVLSPRELRALSQRYNSVYLCPKSYTCARLAAGGACSAVGAVLGGQVRSALAVLRPPGHHARPSSAGGFCLFNNVGVAARHAQSLAGSPLRVLILDWDVHHGNGTQEIFEEDPSVLYMSLHRHDGSFFPGGAGGSPRRRGRGPGTGFTLNVGWGGPRVGDPEYLAALTRLLLPVACQFGPELVLVSAGFDAGRGDPLGGCLVSPQTFGLMTHLLGGLAGGRLVLVLEGGYNLAVTAEGVGQCLGVLLGDPPTLPPPGTPQPAALRALSRTLRAQRGSWSCLQLPHAEPPQESPKEGAGSDDVTSTTGDVTGSADLDSAIHRLGALQLGDAPGAEPPPGPAPTAAAAAAPCWEEEEELEEGALYAVTPLLECPHLGAVAPPPPGGALGTVLPPPCGTCGSRRENWLCLSCHQVQCGRYVGGHMVEHGDASGHPLVLSLRDLAAWCYPCGGYVTHPVLLPTKTFIYRLKFGSDPPTSSF
ncbi:histone deacetylase 6 isoform X2 [Cinclus cinclus]|uniref:histone deacetylase 6 isoform X2 n=1 Tax=Cinclus cinclus TaxID=127875 RepID=UPI002E13CB73